MSGNYEPEVDPAKQYSATHLFLRADERMAQVEAQIHDHGLGLQDARNGLKALEERVNMGVARTGNENRTDIAELKTKVALLERENGEMKKQLFDKDTGLVTQFNEQRAWQKNFNNSVTTFFIVQLAGGLILWAVKHFR